MKFEVYMSSKSKEWYFRLVSSNGQIVAKSEGYTTKAAALKTIESIKEKVSSATVVEE